MDEPELEELFLRFRDQGDAHALAAVFDRTAGELLTLALHLAPEASAAEDLVQATFLAAIQGADSFEHGRRLMPWLVGILANQAARARRDRSRVIDPLRVEARPEPDPAHASEQREIFATLTRAIDDLPDACRESVRRHLLEGERAVDIARADGTAPGTVRMQILRGLERLRRTLPAGLLSAIPVGVEVGRIPAIRAVVMSASREHVRQLATGTTGGTASSSAAVPHMSAIGSVLMSMKLWLWLSAALIVLLVSWSVMSAREPSSTTSIERAPTPSIESASSPSQSAAAASRRSPAKSLDAATSSANANGYRLSGEVRGLDGFAARDVVITVNQLDALAVHADESGHYEVDLSKMFDGSGPSPYELGIFAKHPANREAEALVSVSMPVAPGTRHPTEHSWNVDLVLKPFVRLTGKLELPKRMNVTSPPWVALFYPRGARTFCARAESDDEGNFALRWDDSGDVVFVASAYGFGLTSMPLSLQRGGTSDLGVIRLARETGALEGRFSPTFDVSNQDIGACAHRKSTSTPIDAPGGVRILIGPEGAEICDHGVGVGADGKFVLRDLPAGEWVVSPEGSTPSMMFLGERSVVCTVPGPPCVIGSGLSYFTIHITSGGQPVSGAWVFVEQDPALLNGWQSDDGGQVTVMAEPARAWELELRKDGLASAHLSIPATSTPVTTRFDVVLAPKVEEPAALVLVADNVADLPEESLQVTFQPLGFGGRWEHRTFARGDGRYELTGLAPGRWRVIVQPNAHHWGTMSGGSLIRDMKFEVDLEAGARLERPIHFEPGGRVRFEVEGWDGASKDNDWARAILRDERGERAELNCEQRFVRQGSFGSCHRADSIGLVGSCDQLSSMAPGKYTLTLAESFVVAEPVTFEVKVGETTTVHVVVARR